METPKKLVSRRAVVRGIALAALAQGLLSVQPALAHTASPLQPLPLQPPSGSDMSSIIGVL